MKSEPRVLRFATIHMGPLFSLADHKQEQFRGLAGSKKEVCQIAGTSNPIHQIQKTWLTRKEGVILGLWISWHFPLFRLLSRFWDREKHLFSQLSGFCAKPVQVMYALGFRPMQLWGSLGLCHLGKCFVMCFHELVRRIVCLCLQNFVMPFVSLCDPFLIVIVLID